MSAPAPGRAALGLARRGARVTGVDASAEMLRVARARAAAGGVDVTFDVGDAHRLAFADRAFHAAVSLRVLMHTPDWRQCLAELCRVADERVVFDYPAALSAAALQAVQPPRCWPRAGRPVEAYRVLRVVGREADARRRRLPRRARAPAVRAAHRAPQGDRVARLHACGGEALAAVGPAAAVRLAGHRGGGAMRALVTGATGFTGGHLARALLRRGDDVRALVRARRRAGGGACRRSASNFGAAT